MMPGTQVPTEFRRSVGREEPGSFNKASAVDPSWQALIRRRAKGTARFCYLIRLYSTSPKKPGARIVSVFLS